MTLLSCIDGGGHRALPRKHRSWHQGRASPMRNADSFDLSGQLCSGPVAQITPPYPITSGTGDGGQSRQLPSRPVSSHDLWRRNGTGAKLKKRPRVPKSIISSPTNFVHCTHLDRTAYGEDSMGVLKPTLERRHTLTLAAALSSAPASGNQQLVAAITAQSVPESCGRRIGGGQTDPHRCKSSTKALAAAGIQAKRKAPPPVTPSIIKEAGLDQVALPPTKALPNESLQDVNETEEASTRDGLPGLPPQALVVSPDQDGIKDGYNSMRADDDPILRRLRTLHPGSPVPPPTVSSIRRDIERLLDGTSDGVPTVSSELGSEPQPQPQSLLGQLTKVGSKTLSADKFPTDHVAIASSHV